MFLKFNFKGVRKKTTNTLRKTKENLYVEKHDFSFRTKKSNDFFDDLETRATFKTLMTFHCTDWFIGILIIASYTSLYKWVVFHPLYIQLPSGKLT